MEIMLHRRDSIIFTTIEVINECGFMGVSTREVARRAGISEGTIFKHFKTKNDLLLAVLDYYSQYDSDIEESTLAKSVGFKEELYFYGNSYIEYYENYPEITAIMHSYDVLSSDPVLGERVRGILDSRSKFVEKLITRAQSLGQISTEINPVTLTIILLGIVRMVCLKWRLEKYSFSLKEECYKTVTLILNSLKIK